MRIREESLARVASGASFDVLIIGGGVNGVAVLRELALNGVSALLVERSDFCKGASGTSSRMAHGGLRYLENREFKLVAESTRERNLLLKYAPHFTRPLEVVVPLTSYLSGLPGSILRFLGVSTRDNTLSAIGLKGALYLYEFLGRVEKALPSHRMLLSRRAFPERIAARYKTLISYFDARISNPEALVLEMIEDALSASHAVACINHAEWRVAENGEIIVADSIDGQTFEVRPKMIVNASGAWVDRVNETLGLPTQYIRPVKGAHLIIRHDELFRRMAGRAFYFDDGTGRMVICYPLDRTILLGTTEVSVADPNDTSITPSEVQYLTASLSSLFDDIEISANHIAAVTTGIRPLQSGGGASANKANRDHLIAEDRLRNGSLPLLSLVGGKWTTFRAFGEQAADRIFGLLGVSRKAGTRRRPYPGAAGFGPGEDGAEQTVSRIARTFGLSPQRAHDLINRYGAIAADVAAYCAEESDRPVTSLPDYSEQEVRWLVERRAAVMLDDLLLRRTQIVLDGRCNAAVIRDFGSILARTRGLDEDWAKAEIARCLEIQALIVHPPASLPTMEARHG